jgi:hypothetical protein
MLPSGRGLTVLAVRDARHKVLLIVKKMMRVGSFFWARLSQTMEFGASQIFPRKIFLEKMAPRRGPPI